VSSLLSASAELLVFYRYHHYELPNGTPSAGALNTLGGKLYFSTKISETVRYRLMATMEHWYEVVSKCSLRHGRSRYIAGCPVTSVQHYRYSFQLVPVVS